jgi:sec-independent protein translocase protein TatA
LFDDERAAATKIPNKENHMFQGLTGLHLIIILGIVVLLFGATKLPALAKGLGQSINIFKKEMETTTKDTPTAAPTATAQATAVPTEPVVNPGPSVQPNTDARQ